MRVAARTGLSPWWLALLSLGCVAIGLLAAINPADALLATGGILFCTIVVTDLTVGFVVFTGLSFLDLLGNIGSFSGMKVLGLLLFVSYLARIATRRSSYATSFATDNPALVVAMIALLSWSLASLVWAQSASTALGGAGRFALNMLLIPIAYAALRDREHLIWAVAAFTAGAVFSAVFGFLDPATTSTGYGDRATGTIGDPNAEAAVLVAAMPLLISLVAVYRKSARARLIAAVSFVVLLAGFAGTLSRGGLVALGAVMIAAVMFGGRWRRKAAVILVVAVTALTAYYVVALPLAARQRVTSSDTSGRTTLWTVALRVFKAHPILGVGTDNFILVEGQYVNQPGAVLAYYVIDAPKVAHDAFLELLVDLGIPGLLAFVSVLMLCGAAAVRAARRFEQLGDEPMEIVARAVVLSIVGVVTSEFFISGQYARFLWLPLAFGPVLLALARRAETDDRALDRAFDRALDDDRAVAV